MSYDQTKILAAVMSLRPNAVPGVDFELASIDGVNQISVWLSETIVQPTQTEIEAINTDLLVPVPQVITDYQFFLQLHIQGIISEQEAIDSNGGVIPAPLLTLINAMPADQILGVKMLVGGATEYHRDHPVTIAIGTAYGWSPVQIDNFFRAAALL